MEYDGLHKLIEAKKADEDRDYIVVELTFEDDAGNCFQTDVEIKKFEMRLEGTVRK